MSWVFRDSITDSLFKPLEILVEEPLFFVQHGADAIQSVGVNIFELATSFENMR